KGQGTPTAPTGTTSGPPAPLPNGNVSGRVENLDTVADLITYNQAANVGLSIPVEGRIERSTGIITRWELPVPLYVDPSIHGNCGGGTALLAIGDRHHVYARRRRRGAANHRACRR